MYFGLDTKRLTQYQKQFYNENKGEALMIQEVLDKQQNADSIPMPLENEEIDDQIAPTEDGSNEMNFLPEDDDYGDNMDGDEMY